MTDLETQPAEAAALEGASLDERALLGRLAALEAAGRIRLAADRRKLSHIDFPLALEADSNQWVYAVVIVAGLVWWRFGTPPGLAAAVAGFLVYQSVGRRVIARRLERRIRTRGLSELETWRKLWRFGGVILTNPATGETCQGPDGRWMGFVQGVERRAPP
ncbi:hypothetical protein GCM10011611_22580 [Aliidongia dinghuensis]|uniref:Uncharacterized protein n=1 Tax=Aliidongia dinghuensis TaxID=1867774 RepID=A0A8J2YSL7_9PROT|nr:hypothetical protein [Aliidongia dinghuensis]GGF16289.1 hypothetical protein GCM10011611_22580 [Aliidongia dinghuensis]